MVVGYGPNEGDGEERFWNDMDRNLDSVGNGYRFCILGDLNGWIGDKTREGITNAFEERIIIVEEWWSFMQKGDCVWITHILSTEVCISTQEWQRVKVLWRLKA